MNPKATTSYRHRSAERTKIPTGQDRPFMPDEDHAPVDFIPESHAMTANVPEHFPPPKAEEGPRLSFRRKNADGSSDAVKALPLWIHEKVNPSAFIEQITGSEAADGIQQTLHAEFNGVPADAKYQWYRHTGHWSNRIIRGDAAGVMASLAAKENLAGKVDMIYWDPPYGISFKKAYQTSAAKRGGDGARAHPAEPEARTAFRDSYEDGIHSYMSGVMRLGAHARSLLAESGSLFMQIGSQNVHLCAVALDEIFGTENRIATITFAKPGSRTSGTIPERTDYILWYAKNKKKVKFRQIYKPLTRVEKIEFMSSYAMVELADGTSRNLSSEERTEPDRYLPAGSRIFQRRSIVSDGGSKTGRSEPFEWDGRTYPCAPTLQWSVGAHGLRRMGNLGRLISTAKGGLRWKWYEDEVPGRKIDDLWAETIQTPDKHYVVETGEKAIERCIQMATDPGDLVLDPTCGSGTTAFVAEKWGRRWITIDASAVPVALCRQRLLTGIYEYYLTQDEPEGQAAEAKLRRDETARTDKQYLSDSGDPASGFVYERVPYVSAKTLGYDEPPQATLLVNRPLKRKGVKRISSPFTVESHSPWVYQPAARQDDDKRDTARAQRVRENVISALETAGVSIPALKGDRWHPQGIEPYGSGINGSAGEITHQAKLVQTGESVAITVVEDDRSASDGVVNKAATAATRAGFDKLLVIAFHFGGEGRGRETRGRLDILKAQANRDLTINELRNGREDTAFVLVGEPEIELRKLNDGRYQVEVIQYHVYNPATGNILTDTGPENIHCWMIDTDYDGQSFYARRIHIPERTPEDKQIKRLTQALGARLNPDEWKYVQSLTSAPFTRPRSGEIAVRIVTAFGDEMLATKLIES